MMRTNVLKHRAYIPRWWCPLPLDQNTAAKFLSSTSPHSRHKPTPFHVPCRVSRPEVSSVYLQGLDNVADWDNEDDWMETVYT